MQLWKPVATTIALTFTACSTEVHPQDYTLDIVGADAPIAIGARLDLDINDACQEPESMCATGRCCTTQPVLGLTAVVDPPTMIVKIDGTSVSLTPTAPGTATLRVAAQLDGNAAEKTMVVDALVIDQVVVDAPQITRPFGENRIAGCLAPVLMELGTGGTIPYRAFAGDTAVVTTGLPVLTASGNAITLGEVGGRPTRGSQSFQAVSIGSGSVASNVGTPSSVTFEVFDPSQVDGIQIAPAGQLILTRVDAVDVDVFVTIGGREACSDTKQRVVVVENPDICTIDGQQAWPKTGGSNAMATMPAGVLRLSIRAVAVGTCRLRAGLVGTNLEDTLSITVNAP